MSNIVNLFAAKEESKYEAAMRDIVKYEEVLNASIAKFHTYSIHEKQSLYEEVARFNIELLKIIHEKKGCEDVS